MSRSQYEERARGRLGPLPEHRPEMALQRRGMLGREPAQSCSGCRPCMPLEYYCLDLLLVELETLDPASQCP